MSETKGSIEKNNQRISSYVWKILLPVTIGIVTVYFLFEKEFNIESFSNLNISYNLLPSISLLFIAFFAREYGMAWRFNILTSGKLNIKKGFLVTFLCEFTSAITPTSVGGSALSMIFMNREGIKIGEAGAYTIIILFLDNLFFTIISPIVLIGFGIINIFDISSLHVNYDFETTFWTAYSLMALMTGLLFSALFVIPDRIAVFIKTLFQLRWLRRWQHKAHDFSENMIIASLNIRKKPSIWWTKAFIATCISWTGRFLVINAIFLCFLPSISQIIVFCRQIIVWGLLMFSPTPGGSGLSEWLFDKFYFDLINSDAVVMIIALLWRVFTYYIYLIIGVFLLPTFLRKNK